MEPALPLSSALPSHALDDARVGLQSDT
jgi:hypothetical protein